MALGLLNPFPHFQQKCAPHLHDMWLQPSFFSMGAWHLGWGGRPGFRVLGGDRQADQGQGSGPRGGGGQAGRPNF